jgi:hypothetical protein
MEACQFKGDYLAANQIEAEAEKLAMVADMGKAIPSDREVEAVNEDPLDVQLETMRAKWGRMCWTFLKSSKNFRRCWQQQFRATSTPNKQAKLKQTMMPQQQQWHQLLSPHQQTSKQEVVKRNQAKGG